MRLPRTTSAPLPRSTTEPHLVFNYPQLPLHEEASVLPDVPVVGEEPLLLALDLEMSEEHMLRFPAFLCLLVSDGLPFFATALLISRTRGGYLLWLGRRAV